MPTLFLPSTRTLWAIWYLRRNRVTTDHESSFQGITDNNKWTLVLSIFYVGYCMWMSFMVIFILLTSFVYRSSRNSCKQWAMCIIKSMNGFIMNHKHSSPTTYWRKPFVSHTSLSPIMRADSTISNSFFISLTFWGLASLSVTYAKGYAGLLVLRFVFELVLH
jgi:hypothetical protein